MTRRALAAVALAGLLALLAAPAVPAAPRCDPFDRAACLLPFPNDFYTRADRTSATGRRLALRRDQMPRNVDRVPIDPRPYNASDGFSPGQTIVTKVPGLDSAAAFRRSGLVGQTDLDRHRARRQPVVVIDTRTGRRHLIWAELDSNARRDSDRVLLVHPGVNWREGRRYVVALRRLRDARGRILPAGRAFRVYRDGRRGGDPRRRRHLERVFRTLRRAGIARRELYLAWDFTVATRATLASRALSIRDRAFATLGDRRLADRRLQGRAPRFRVIRVQELTGGGLARRVEARVTVPCYLDRRGCPPGSRFRLGRDGLPVRLGGNAHEVRLICVVPRGATGRTPGRPLLYGHGLLGSAEEVDSIAVLAQAANAVLCGTDWTGFAREDVRNLVSRVLRDLSEFPDVPDRTQQGMLDHLFVGRLMIHPDGLGAHPAFREGGRSVIDDRRLFYAGGSQGGILGGFLTALAPDFDRAALVVGAMNYSLLLPRATPFIEFSRVLYPRYPDELERPLVISLIQVLWDRGEPNGYAWHMTDDPYPNTPPHTVLLHQAFGDHQVANIATEVEARTIGARLRAPALDPGRSRDRRPYYGIRPIPRYPWAGSVLTVFDTGPLRNGGEDGTPPPPAANLPPGPGDDPHGDTAYSAAAAAQFFEFLKVDGEFEDTCSRRPCYAAGWEGP